jgi:cellulose synthase/poly-beta-1,6-N-acetylglucosamine synthase-like glycosyltransferase
MVVMSLLAAVLVLGLLAVLSYRWLFTLGYLSKGRRARPADPSIRRRSFAVLVPAHDEEMLIGDLIRSIRAADYPPERIQIVVIADNCSDRTVERASELGAVTHERNDPKDRGKGQALRWGLGRIELNSFDAVAVVDADNRVDPGFFSAMNRELDRGARVLQGYDGLSNPGESALTRMVEISSVMKNLLFCGGKAALGFSTLLMGTGMVFTSEVLKQIGWHATSIGEDLEQSFVLAEMGVPIRFVSDARVYAQEAVTLRQGFAQRQRWASGRQALRSRGLRAIRDGLRRRQWGLVDAGIEIVVPTYSMTLNLTAIAGVLSLAVIPATAWPASGVALLVAAEVAEVAVALREMRADREFVLSIAVAPVFLVWKGCIDLLAIFGYRRHHWSRTQRHSQR